VLLAPLTDLSSLHTNAKRKARTIGASVSCSAPAWGLLDTKVIEKRAKVQIINIVAQLLDDLSSWLASVGKRATGGSIYQVRW
jgi:hypothetical protein